MDREPSSATARVGGVERERNGAMSRPLPDPSVSVILPALNEEATVGRIAGEIRGKLMGRRPTVHELLVLDSGSTDDTARVAREAGARVVRSGEVLSRIPAVVGKGEAMWRALAATSGDIVVFIDADLDSFAAEHVAALVEPLAACGDVHLVKAAYHRPVVNSAGGPIGGGRVTELVARPLLNLYWPALAGLIQPLAGEYAARRSLLERLRFPCGYGVEFALLVDTLDLLGPDALAQVDLGTRIHPHQDDLSLGRMSAEIIQVAMSRLRPDVPAAGRVVGNTLTQFTRAGDDAFAAQVFDVGALERPPLREVPEYVGRDAARAC